VDCSNYYDNDGYYLNFGCDGGRTRDSWLYAKDWGMITEADYPYMDTEGRCKFDDHQAKVTFQFDTIININGENEVATVEEIATAMHQGPVSATINAACDALWFYDSGVLRSADCPESTLEYGHPNNHYVSLVAYEPAQEGPYEKPYITKEV